MSLEGLCIRDLTFRCGTSSCNLPTANQSNRPWNGRCHELDNSWSWFAA